MAFSRIYFFGDSLTDQGRMHDLSAATAVATIPVTGAGYTGAFSNGPVHAEVLAGLLGAEAANYAVGGAKAVGVQTVEDYLTPRLGGQIPGLDIFRDDADPAALATDINLGGQVGAFVGDVLGGAAPPPGAAAAFLVGANDYSEFRPTSPETALAEATALVQAVVGNTIASAAAAVQRGVETVVLYTMPNFRFFPLAGLQTEELLALGDQLIAAHNAGLAQGGKAALEAMGATVEVVALDRMSAEIMADPETFGLDAALFRAPLLLGTGGNPRLVEGPGGEVAAVFAPNPAVAGVDPERVAFIDFAHPGESVHATWGAFGAASLTSETFLMGAGDDRVVGTRGADLVLAGAGDDAISGLAGADVVLAGLGDDRVGGGAGADILSGGAGDDVLCGGCGADVLAGGPGDDRAYGGRGSDALIAAGGFDLLFGGRGDDVFILAQGAAEGGRMAGGAGADTLYLVVDAATRAAVEAEWSAGANRQKLDAVGLETSGIETLVFLDPDSDWVLDVATPAPLDQAALWGLL